LIRKWDAICHLQQFGCTINIGLHRGTLYAFRSFLFGRDVWIASQVPEVEANHLVLVSVLGTYGLDSSADDVDSSG
jgi:hypothetical protein